MDACCPDLLRWRLLREGRFALTSVTGAALAGSKSATALVGGEVLFHAVDEIGVGVWTVAALAPAAAQRDSGELQNAIAPELVLVPVKGRPPTLFGSTWLPAYDVHLIVGGGWVGLSFGVDYRVLASCRPGGHTPPGVLAR